MSLALDYMGKFIIVMVVVGVVTTLLVGLSSQFDEIPWSPENDKDEDIGRNEIVEASSASDVADFVDICVSQTRDRYTDVDCFVVRHSSASFDIDNSSIADNLDSSLSSVEFLNDEYNREIITVRYDITKEKVVVEE